MVAAIRHRRRMASWGTAAGIGFALVAGACTVTVDGLDSAADAGMLGLAASSDVDAVTTVVVADVEAYWTRVLPEVWGRDFVPVAGIGPYDSATGPIDSLPECGGERVPREESANAFYCGAADTIYWDREVLFADLLDVIGDLAVATVVAHEYAHAIQLRTGAYDDVGDDADEAIVLELQADCYAGAWLGDLAERRDAREGGELDEAAAGLLAVRDPVGTGAAAESAHGNAFDRLSALTEGFEDGAAACATYPAVLPLVTARTFARSELATGGNLPFSDLAPLLTAGLDQAWEAFTGEGGTVAGDGRLRPDAPPVIEVVDGRLAARSCDGADLAPGDLRGLAVACPGDGLVLVDDEDLVGALMALGDFAATYPIVHAWGQFFFPGDPDPVAVGDCVAGAWSRAVFDGELPLTLSPGDLDEAVASFSVYAPPEPASTVRVLDSTFARFGDMRRGFVSGVAACGS